MAVAQYQYSHLVLELNYGTCIARKWCLSYQYSSCSTIPLLYIYVLFFFLRLKWETVVYFHGFGANAHYESCYSGFLSNLLLFRTPAKFVSSSFTFLINFR